MHLELLEQPSTKSTPMLLSEAVRQAVIDTITEDFNGIVADFAYTVGLDKSIISRVKNGTKDLSSQSYNLIWGTVGLEIRPKMYDKIAKTISFRDALLAALRQRYGLSGEPNSIGHSERRYTREGYAFEVNAMQVADDCGLSYPSIWRLVNDPQANTKAKVMDALFPVLGLELWRKGRRLC